MPEKKKFIIDVVPLTKIPLTTRQAFSYLSDMRINRGSLVSIPLFRRQVEGIAMGTRQDFERLGNIELKKITAVLEENFVTEKQLELAEFLSKHYVSPFGIVLKGFVPKRVKGRKPKAGSVAYEKPSIKLTLEQKIAIGKISKGKDKFLLFGPAGAGKTEVYIHSILEIAKKKKDAQFLILLPEKTLTPQALERYGQYFPSEKIVIFSSNISKGHLYENWQKVKSGEATIVIGTRMAVFAPFKSLQLIVVDEEQDMSHKQWDMNPRYDARTAAEKLGDIFKSPVVRGSATPLLESYHRAKNGNLKLLELPPLDLESMKSVNKTLNKRYKVPDTVLVDMKKERWEKNYSCISKKLKGEIAYVLKNSQQAVLYINRQGMSSFSVCKSCKTVMKCPVCDRSLVYDEKGHYRCLHCAYRTSITPSCAKCGGIAFQNVGLGTQKVEREVNNFFPGARIARLDTQAVSDPKSQEKIYREFSAGEIDILVGTQMITKGWDLPNVALVGIIDADNALSVPDFSADERFYENLVQAAGRTGRPGAKYRGTVVIQTYQPENKIIKMVAERDYDNFSKHVLEERKSLGFPPFGRIVKLIFQDFSSETVRKESERAQKTLAGIPEVRVSEEQEAFIPKVRGRFRRQMVIKFKGEMPDALKKELIKLKSGWIIDIDPVSLT